MSIEENQVKKKEEEKGINWENGFSWGELEMYDIYYYY